MSSPSRYSARVVVEQPVQGPVEVARRYPLATVMPSPAEAGGAATSRHDLASTRSRAGGRPRRTARGSAPRSRGYQSCPRPRRSLRPRRGCRRPCCAGRAGGCANSTTERPVVGPDVRRRAAASSRADRRDVDGVDAVVPDAEGRGAAGDGAGQLRARSVWTGRSRCSPPRPAAAARHSAAMFSAS